MIGLPHLLVLFFAALTLGMILRKSRERLASHGVAHQPTLNFCETDMRD